MSSALVLFSVRMEQSESILEAIFGEETLEDEDLEDVEMLDAETLVKEPPSQQIRADDSAKGGGNGGDDYKAGKQEPPSRNSKRRKSKKKKKSGVASNITDINRFVVDTCRHLKERKSYLVWNAVGVLGTSTLSDLVKEVDAIQNCGGQLTADGKRFRSSGGVLWNILKTREPKAYKEIMAKGREFEKQFRQKNTKQNLQGNKEATSKIAAQESDKISSQVSERSNFTLETEVKPAQCDSHEGRASVMSRIRAPVTYGDLFEEDENVLT